MENIMDSLEREYIKYFGKIDERFADYADMALSKIEEDTREELSNGY